MYEATISGDWQYVQAQRGVDTRMDLESRV
jgi:hypothetical protein